MSEDGEIEPEEVASKTFTAGQLVITVTSPVPLPGDIMTAVLKRLWSQVGSQSLGDIDPRLQDNIKLRLEAETKLGHVE